MGAAIYIAWRNRRDRLSGVMLAYLVFYLSFCLLNANIDLPENVSLFFVCVAIVLHRNAAASLVAEPEAQPGGPALEGGGLAVLEPSGLLRPGPDAALHIVE